jgi:hypothetical protein
MQTMTPIVEVNADFKAADTDRERSGHVVSITPPIDAEYFLARVVLYRDQAINIFPKFFTIGCGFAKEEDWNTNLPLTKDAVEIYEHIAHNKCYEEITREQCIEAIRALQEWWKANGPGVEYKVRPERL